MNLKKPFSYFLIASLLSGCAKQPVNSVSKNTTATKMTPGTYEASAEGHNGAVHVSVTVSEDKIENVEVKDNSETRGLSDPAIQLIPSQIVAYQTLSTDVVSGATHTTVAIREAVKNCIIQAGGNPDAYNTKIPNDEKGQEEELSSDVIVVGGGAAGMAATIRLEEAGKSVILVEKTSSLGGTIRVSGGNQVVQGSKVQKEAGVTNDSVKSMVEDFLKNGDQLNDTELLGIYAKNVGAATDWLSDDVGVRYNMEGGLHQLAEYAIDRELAYDEGGIGAAETLNDKVHATDANVLLNTVAKHLIVENGKVTGVEAESQKGKKYTLKADAVILATGGYGNNNDLLPASARNGLFYGLDSSNGEGLVMAVEDANAGTTHMEYIKEYPNGVETSKKHAKSTIAGNITAFSKAAILVNQKGERVVNEKASNHDILNALKKQSGETLYLVMDEATFNEWKTKLAAAGLSEDMIDAYVANNGKSKPVFTMGATIKEAAEAAGIDGNALTKTIEKFNTYVEDGEDKAFHRAKEYLTSTFAEGNIYIVEQKARYATTMGGLDVDGNLQVVDTNGKVIDGLYAAGEIIGGVMGDDSPSGANNGWALTSGKYVADYLSK
ncbi:MAG: FAD-dependent oxidoreductase [Bulleidia sp.]|nr:FAD-dependent oxidoreductase [Bulleidia sp.]